jgi:chemotaxis protein CheX
MVNAAILEQLKTSGEQLIEHLDHDVREIFSTMIGMELPASQVADTVTRFKDCVTAMIGFAGSYHGMISINTPQTLALSIASQMLGMELTECDDDVRDALGEIANMVGGSFKHHFVKDGHEVRLSTPSVMSGDEYVMNTGSAPDTLTLMFECSGDHFGVNVYLETGE